MNTNLDKAPEIIKKIQTEDINNLDVRPILQAGGEPFSPIMEAIAKTSDTGALRLRATFEPTPLFRVLGSQGWAYWVEYGAGDDWMIWFYKERAETSKVSESDETASLASVGLDQLVEQYPELPKRIHVTKKSWTLDVRDLLPPEPMEMTLAILNEIPEDVCLIQINQRVPQFLLPLLAERGLTSQVLKNEKNEVQIEIKKQ